MRPFPEVPGVEVEHRFVDAGGLRIHVAECGDGEPLVLLHGWPQHWWMWRGALPALSQHYRCIVPDLRGLGWSDAPASGYDKPQLAADVLALLDALGLQTVRLMGHDWGAFTSLLIAPQAPARVERRWSLMDFPLPWDRSPDPRRLIAAAHVPFLSAPFAENGVPVPRGPDPRGRAGWAPRRARSSSTRCAPPSGAARPSATTARSCCTRSPARWRARCRARTSSCSPSAGRPTRSSAGRTASRRSRAPAHFLVDDRPDAVVDRTLPFLAA